MPEHQVDDQQAGGTQQGVDGAMDREAAAVARWARGWVERYGDQAEALDRRDRRSALAGAFVEAFGPAQPADFLDWLPIAERVVEEFLVDQEASGSH